MSSNIEHSVGHRVRQLLGNRFLRDGATLASASLFLQALSVITAPIMARLYGPESYGLLGLYIAATGIVNVPAHWQYQGAIILPKDDRDALALIKAGLVLSALTTGILCLVFALPLEHWTARTEYAHLLPWIPLVIAMTMPGSLITFAATWLARKQEFRLLSVMRIAMNLSSTIFGMAWGMYIGNASGLLWANIAGMACGGLVLVYGMRKTSALEFITVETHRVWDMLVRYRDFPLFATPTQLLMQFSRQAPVLLLTGFAGASAVGYFNMSNRLLGLPNVLFAESLSTVFSQRAAKRYAETGECRDLYRKMFWGLLLTTTPVVIVLAIIAPSLFAWLLGERWRVAGEYSRVLCWLFSVQLVCTPLSSMMTIARRQAENMWLQIISCISTVGLMYAAYTLFGTATAVLVGFTIAATATQLYYGIRGFWLSSPVCKPRQSG
jgi:O-antigen/teichoic acid export membrane protein